MMSSHLGSSEDKDQVCLQVCLLQARCWWEWGNYNSYSSCENSVSVGRDSQPLQANLQDAQVY